MRNWLAIFCAAVMVVAVSSVAGASPMDSLNWQPYDTFPGSNLNTALWTVENSDGTLTTGAGGLTLTPSSLSGTGNSTLDIAATLTISNGSFFAARVPFSITTDSAGSGGLVTFGITLSSSDYSKASSIGWANANNLSIDGSTLNGTAFVFSTDHNPPANIQNTSITMGDLGLIDSGGMITMYYNDGTGWYQLGAPNPTVGWAGTLVFDLTATINKSGSLTVAVPEVDVGTPVPEPSAILFLVPGLVGLVGFRRKFKE